MLAYLGGPKSFSRKSKEIDECYHILLIPPISPRWANGDATPICSTEAGTTTTTTTTTAVGAICNVGDVVQAVHILWSLWRRWGATIADINSDKITVDWHDGSTTGRTMSHAQVYKDGVPCQAFTLCIRQMYLNGRSSYCVDSTFLLRSSKRIVGVSHMCVGKI